MSDQMLSVSRRTSSVTSSISCSGTHALRMMSTEFQRRSCAAWQTATIAAGLGKMVCRICGREGVERRCPTCKSEFKYVGRIFHDLRRSAVKHMDDAGISRDVAMSISGHKTDSMYSRYNICDLKRRRKALERVQEFRERMAVEQAQSNVIAMR